MNRLRTLVPASLIALLLTAAPAGAVIGGQPDGAAHPYVVSVAVPSTQTICTGSLISPTLVVTAAHCFVGSNNFAFVGSGHAFNFVSAGRATVHESFCFECGNGLGNLASHDIAVLELVAPVNVSRYAQLPTEGMSDGLGRAPLTIVGYGVQGFDPGPIFSEQGRLVFPQTPTSNLVRTSATVSLVPGKHSWRDEFLRVSASRAGTCFGDSGGPSLVGDTIVAVTSFSNHMCAGNTYAYRLDTAAALEFVSRFQ